MCIEYVLGGLFWIIYICIFGIARLFSFQYFEWVVPCFLLVEHYGGIGSISIVVGLVVC